jgi:hypothetical protein
MFEIPLELRVPAKATNVGTFVRCQTFRKWDQIYELHEGVFTLRSKTNILISLIIAVWLFWMNHMMSNKAEAAR